MTASTPTHDEALRLLRKMLLIRRFEERAAEDCTRPRRSAGSCTCTSARRRSQSA